MVDVVDKNDKVIKTVERDAASPHDILRTTNIFILNKKGEILLQLRSANRRYYPLHWDSTGGHVTSGEDVLKSAKRELYEEIGVKTELMFLGKHLIELPDERSHMSSYFKGVYDGKMKIDPKEVEKVQFFSVQEIKRMINKKGKIHPECAFGLKRHFLWIK